MCWRVRGSWRCSFSVCFIVGVSFSWICILSGSCSWSVSFCVRMSGRWSGMFSVIVSFRSSGCVAVLFGVGM